MDQLDLEVIRTSATNATPSAYLVCRRRPPQRTFTFTAPNLSQRTNEPDTMPHENHKNREKSGQKWSLCAFLKKNSFYNEKIGQGDFCHL